MEFVNGQTLADAMKKGERVSMDRVCEIGQQIAEALGYAHRKGVIHRDIKPANILLTSRETYGIERPRITDFGVAKLTAGEITTTGQMLGTPAFMPPEQFTGAPIDGRTDLFSLGVILYWMATGEQPFPGETMTTVSYKIVHTEPVPPAKLNPVIPSQLNNLILKCLAKSPADRYQTGEELAQALAAVRSGAAPASMNTAAPQATFAGGDAEATLDASPSLLPGSTAAATVSSIRSGADSLTDFSRSHSKEPHRADRHSSSSCCHGSRRRMVHACIAVSLPLRCPRRLLLRCLKLRQRRHQWRRLPKNLLFPRRPRRQKRQPRQSLPQLRLSPPPHLSSVWPRLPSTPKRSTPSKMRALKIDLATCRPPWRSPSK